MVSEHRKASPYMDIESAKRKAKNKGLRGYKIVKKLL